MKESHSVLSFCRYMRNKNKRKKRKKGKGFFLYVLRTAIRK